MPDPYGFPSFPSKYTEKDTELLTKLKEQKTSFNKLYQQRYTPQAWEELPDWQTTPLETLRNITTKAPASFIWDIAPDVFLTLKLAREKSLSLDREIFELERRQRVTNRLPFIQAELVYNKLIGNPITDPKDLKNVFADLSIDFTKEEQLWLTAFAHGVALSEPGSLLAGEGFIGSGTPMEISDSAIQDWYRQNLPEAKPEQIMSSVAFSKDVNQIGQYLQAAYPPQTGDPTTDTELLKALTDYYKRMAVKQGIVPLEGESIEDLTKRVHEIAAAEGQDIVLEFSEEGLATTIGGFPPTAEGFPETTKTFPVQAKLFPDKGVFVQNKIGDEKIGTYNSETKEIEPLSEEEYFASLNQVPFSFVTPEGEEMNLVWKLSDNSVWWEEEHIGAFDKEGNFVARDLTIGEKIKEGFYTGLEYIDIPISYVGSAVYGKTHRLSLTEEEKAIDTWYEEEVKNLETKYDINRYGISGLIHRLGKGEEGYLEELQALNQERLARGGFDTTDFQAVTKRDREQYEELHWLEKMVYDLPLFMLLAFAGVTAMGSRAALAPFSVGGRAATKKAATAAAKKAAESGIGGLTPTVKGTAALAPAVTATRAVLAPLAGLEWTTGKIFYSVFGVGGKKLFHTASEKAFKKVWTANPLKKVFPEGSEEYKSLYDMWKLYHTKPPKGQPDTLYEKVAMDSFYAHMKNNPMFREGIMAWKTTAAGTGAKTGAEAGATAGAEAGTKTGAEAGIKILTTETGVKTTITEATLIDTVYSVTRGASIEVQDSVGNLLKAITEQNISPANISPAFISRTLPEGSVLEKTPSLVKQLETLNYTRPQIKMMDAEEAWAVLLSNNKVPILPKLVLPEELALPVRAQNKVHELQSELARITEDVEVFERTHFLAQEKITLLQEQKAFPYEVEAEIEKASHLLAEAEKSKAFINTLETEIASVKAKAIKKLSPQTTTVKKAWEKLPLPERLALLKRASLAKNLSTKSWKELTPIQQEQITKIPALESPIIEDLPAKVQELMVKPINETFPPVTDEGLLRIPSFAELQHCYWETEAKFPAQMRMSRKGEKARRQYLSVGRTHWDSLDKETKGLLAKELGLDKPLKVKALKTWADLPLEDKAAIALDCIPDGSISPEPFRFLPRASTKFFNIEQELELYEEAAGGLIKPGLLYTMQARPMVKGVLDVKRDEFARDIGVKKWLEKEINSKEAQARIQASLEADYAGTTAPELTKNELELKNVVSARTKTFEPYARIIKFRFYYSPNVDKMMKAFPDVTDPAELETAIKLYRTFVMNKKLLEKVSFEGRPSLEQQVDAQWLSFVEYMNGRDWGLIKNGFSPRMAINPSLIEGIPDLPLTAKRGRGRLMNRKSIEPPKNVVPLLKALYLYERQMLSLWYMADVWEAFDGILHLAWDKLADPNAFYTTLTSYKHTVEGYPGDDNIMLDIMGRVRTTSAVTVFNTMPYLPVRNLHQGGAFHFERLEYLKAQFGAKFPDANMEDIHNIACETLMNEFKGIKMDFLWEGGKFIWTGAPKGLVKPFTAAAELAERSDAYALSDFIIRNASAKGYGLKAYRASQNFLKDGNKDKWIQDSGAMNLRRLERSQALFLLLQNKVDLIIPGLRNLKGTEAATIYLEDHETAFTHFLYHRNERAVIEMGDIGKLTWELATFQRQYTQRMYQQLEAFAEAMAEKDWKKAKVPFKNIINILFFGSVASSMVSWETGRRKRAPYGLFDVLNWELGGFAIGVTQDISYCANQMLIGINPDTSPEEKIQAKMNSITRLTQLGDTMLPWYCTALNTISAGADLDPDSRIDREWIKSMREWIDENYTKEELEKGEATLAEQFQRAAFGGTPVEPDLYEETLDRLNTFEDQLGCLTDVGQLYTTKEFGNGINAARMKAVTPDKGLPDMYFTAEHGFSPLVTDYFTYVKEWDALQRITPRAREEYIQEQGAEFDAWLLFWGKRNNPSQNTAAKNWQAFQIMERSFEIYKIDANAHPHFRSWKNLSEEEWIIWCREHLNQ